MKLRCFCSVILTMSAVSATAASGLDFNRFDKKMNALVRSLKFMAERPGQMNVDTILGVTFVEANIKAALAHKNLLYIDNHGRSMLKEILKLATHTRKHLLRSLALNEDIKQVINAINDPDLWIEPVVWRNMENNDAHRSTNDKKNHSTRALQDHSQSRTSDRCIVRVIQSCEIDDVCRDFALRDLDSAQAYTSTHKLLLIKLASALRCDAEISDVSPFVTYALCASMMRELTSYEAAGFPNVSKDLATEQILLCGMEGYLNFLGRHYEQLLLDWQHPSGCYSGVKYSLDATLKRRYYRRSGSFVDYGCVNHATGLGAAALALMIRKDIETFSS
ncbi:UPF0764 protein C16orf89 homolog [Trichogramma pretiosum]|uniref:UPF0764 protein C16orf89 homolog n=1 Tax=Trichogramma pretiosum TaxID=7493 RepID=UPI000C71C23F|nr:UPF0764 protein C16orf89 homolog [Trichogramma pretiosum]